MGVNLASLSSTQSGEPDAGCQLSPRVDHGGTHRSTLDVTGPGRPVSWSSWSSAPQSPLGIAWSNTQSGEPDARCQLPPRVNHGGTHRLTLGLASPGVSRSGSEIPSYGGTHQERHLPPVRLERRSGVTRIVASAELPSLGITYRSRRVGVAAREARWSVRVLT